MRLITRHIVRALAAPFIWGMVALTGLLLLNQISSLINQFGGKGLGLDVMLEAVVLALPALLVLTLPMAVLVSTLYAYSQLAADQEMVAMYANGISVWRMVRPALVAAAIVAIVNFIIFDQVVPRSNIRIRSLRWDVMNKTPTLALRPAQLNPLPPTSYILRAATIDGSNGEMTDVTIYDMSSYSGRRVLHATSGRMAESPNGDDLLLLLRHGEQLDIKSLEPGRIERTTFEVNRIAIKGVANQLQRSDQSEDRGDREMSGCQLLDGVTEQEWNLRGVQRDREYSTRRDLRHMLSLPQVPQPNVQVTPEFPPHCGAYRTFEEWFGQLIVPNARRLRDSLKPDDLRRDERPISRGDSTPPLPARAKLPASTAPILAPTPEFLPQPIPAPVVTAPPTTAVTPPGTGSDSSVINRKKRVPPALVAAPTDSTPPLSADSVKAILGAVVPEAKHTASADSAYALALRQQAMNAPTAVAPGATVPTEVAPRIPGDSGQHFLVPPQGSAPVVGPIGTIEQVRSMSASADRAISMIRQYQVEYHKKFSIPLGSFCFVLLGVALALKYPRSGIGLVIAASLIIFMTFYVLLIGGENIANKGYISAVTAMHGPVLLFTVAGLLGIIAANREMGTARTGGILDGLFAQLRKAFRRKP